MSDNRLPIDDPRLTAYALGELEPAEAAEVERLLDASPGSRGAVDEIRELAGMLTGELRLERAPGLLPEQRTTILQAAADGPRNGVVAVDPAEASPRPPSETPPGGSRTGRWGRRFASLMTIAAMIMVALIVLPTQRPSVPGGAVDHFYAERDFDGNGLDDLDSTHRWSMSHRGMEQDFRKFGVANELGFQLEGAELREDSLRELSDAPVDGTKAAPLVMDESLSNQPASAAAASLAIARSEATRKQFDVRAKDNLEAKPRSAMGRTPMASRARKSGLGMPGVSDRRNGQEDPQATDVDSLVADSSGPATGPVKESGQRKSLEAYARGGRRFGDSTGTANSRAAGLAGASSPPAGQIGRESASSGMEVAGGSPFGGQKPASFAAPNAESAPAGENGGALGGMGAGFGSGGGSPLKGRALARLEHMDGKSKSDPSQQVPMLSKKLSSESRSLNGSTKEAGPATKADDKGEKAHPASLHDLPEEEAVKESKVIALKDGEPRSDNKAFRLKVNQRGQDRAGAPDSDSPPGDKSAEGAPQGDGQADKSEWNDLSRDKRPGEADEGEPSGNATRLYSLTKPVTVNADKAPLQEVVKQLANLGEFRYVFDAEGLTQQGVSPRTPVTVNFDSVPAEIALKQVLSPLALDYAVTDDVVRITNRAQIVESEQAPGTEQYEPIVENPFVTPFAAPLSTFSIDVDTASYSNIRRFITQHQLPPRNAVRVEEMVNYFAYDYPQPGDNRPVSVNVDVGAAPWRPEHRLVRIGLKAREIPRDRRPASNLVFLVDVSGSMSSENKLPLVKRGLTLLTQQMTEGDRVAIVTYSDAALVRLDSTTGDNQKPILDTINGLQAAGSTNGAGGIQLAYRTAIDHFLDGGTNRVILCTDGDFNVGVSDDDELVRLIQDRARSKVFFSVFGFGMGNLKDGKLEKLADKGNGHYAYIGDQREAQKVFVDELTSTLITVAKDVKLQVEFNPARVGAYRLIGYENRALATQDFHDDRKDAGEMGAGHTVTALYEIATADRFPPAPAGEALRYQRVGLAQAGDVGRELLSVRVRYKLPEADESSLFEVPVIDPVPQVANDESDRKDAPAPSLPRPSRDFEWAAAVAAYGMVLRDSQYRGQAGLDLILELAQGARGDDPTGRRQEFIDLVQQTKSIRPSLATTEPLLAPVRAPVALTPQQAEERATVNGKYRNLLRIIPADADTAHYGMFHDYGRWDGTSYLGHDNLPLGHWVYVAPNWYIWGDADESGANKP